MTNLVVLVLAGSAGVALISTVHEALRDRPLRVPGALRRRRERAEARQAKVVAEAGLGRIVDEYRMISAAEFVVAGFFGILAAAALVAGDQLGRILGAAIGLIALGFGALGWRKFRRRLFVCTGGLLLTVRATVATRRVTWDEIASVRVWTVRVYQFGPWQEFPRCALELADGTRMNLHAPPYEEMVDLAEEVEHRVTEVRRPRRLAELDRTGETVFGPLTVTALGVRSGERMVTWSEITRVQRGRTRLRIWTDAPRPVVSRLVRRIPDLAVLVDLVADRAAASGSGRFRPGDPPSRWARIPVLAAISDRPDR